MPRQLEVRRQHSYGILGGKSLRRKGWIRQDADKRCLSKWTGGPSTPRVPRKPTPSPFVRFVLWPGQCDQQVCIEQEDGHYISSSSNSFTRARETRSPSASAPACPSLAGLTRRRRLLMEWRDLWRNFSAVERRHRRG